MTTPNPRGFDPEQSTADNLGRLGYIDRVTRSRGGSVHNIWKGCKLVLITRSVAEVNEWLRERHGEATKCPE